MNKLWLIIKREYLTRVKKRSFIILTIITPFLIVAFIALVVLIMTYTGGKTQKILVKNETGFEFTLKDTQRAIFNFRDAEGLDKDTLKLTYRNKGYDAFVYLPKIEHLKQTSIDGDYYSHEQASQMLLVMLASDIEQKIKEIKIDSSGIDRVLLNSFDTSVELEEKSVAINDKGEAEDVDKSNSGKIAAGMGFFMGMLMYFVIFFYGMAVMRSVMEEKMNRIVEVIISSVKPFQLMLGKLIGVGGVGLTQVLIWALFIPLLYFVVLPMLPIDPDALQQNSQISPEEMEEQADNIFVIIDQIMALNWWYYLSLFLFYFLGGYFIYSSLFAAVGSAIGDDLGESQSLTLPITLPVILAIYIAMNVITNPNTPLATFGSIFPLFSPIVMPARMFSDPPLWEVAVSMLVLVLSVLFFTWLSARIYRIGILMYGKKVTFKEIGKWLFYSD